MLILTDNPLSFFYIFSTPTMFKVFVPIILLNGILFLKLMLRYNKQHCLQQARNNYLRDGRAEDKYDEYLYRNQLEDERIENKPNYNFRDDPEHIIQVPIENITSSHSQRKHYTQ